MWSGVNVSASIHMTARGEERGTSARMWTRERDAKNHRRDGRGEEAWQEIRIREGRRVMKVIRIR